MQSWLLTIYLNSRSFITVRTFSVSICVCCLTYLLITISPRLSVSNLITREWAVTQADNIDRILSKFERPLNKRGSKSFICDRMKKSNGSRETNFTTPIEDHLLNKLRPYCDIVPSPRDSWIPAKRYVESDVVFLIYTGAAFYHTRATSIRDTWVLRVTHKYFLSATPYPFLPVTVIEGAGEDYLSNMKKLYYGMQVAYKKHKDTAKFYFLVGCDTFVNVPHLLKRLDDYDYRKPLVIGGYPYQYQCYIKRNETPHKITYPSGGAGFFLSARTMEMMQPKLNPFFENDWPLTQDRAFSDVALNCLAQSMGILPTLLPGFWAFSPEQTLKDSGSRQLRSAPEPNTFHYVHPSSMAVLDEFYIHQLLDRFDNDRNFEELMKFTRHFVSTHYELLRIKNRECTLPVVRQGKK